jgi:pimeloyl-ACP methyl ester carboxylesterase
MIEQFRALGGDADGQRGVREQLSAAFPEAELDRLVATRRHLRPEVVRALADCWNTGHPDGKRPSSYAGPVLILRGEGDGFVTEDMVNDAIAPRFTAMTAVSVAEAGHWAHIEQAAHVATHLDRLLAEAHGTDPPPRTPPARRGGRTPSHRSPPPPSVRRSPRTWSWRRAS